MTPEEIVGLLGATTPDLSSRIGKMEKTWTHGSAKISGQFFYVRFRQGLPTISDLVQVAHARMVNFAIPRSRIEEAIKQITVSGAQDAWVLLATEARDLFIKTHQETGRSGELGEILLYMLIEWVLKAPIVACKMYLKTAKQMPVHGTDGIHLGFEGDHLLVYWGESKMHGELSSALTDIADSIVEHISSEKHGNDIRILRENLNLGAEDHAARDAIKRFFNPYEEDSNKLSECYACLAGFDSKIYEDVATLNHTVCEAAFREKYEKRIETACKLISEKAEASKLDHLQFKYFLLPFPSVDDARDQFQKKLWGTT